MASNPLILARVTGSRNSVSHKESGLPTECHETLLDLQRPLKLFAQTPLTLVSKHRFSRTPNRWNGNGTHSPVRRWNAGVPPHSSGDTAAEQNSTRFSLVNPNNSTA